MSLTHQPKNGLLLLLQAARKLDEEGPSRRTCYSDDWGHRSHHRSTYDHKYALQHNLMSKRPMGSTRCTHNELEKGRRAHLRTCMEALKEHLNFDNDVPRITMLTVLKKATSTIQYLEHKNKCLETFEENEKQRCAQLLKRRQLLKKKLEEKRGRYLKMQNWRERNRNCSECSINTTSSDDSEMDLLPRQINRSELTASFGVPNMSRHVFNVISKVEESNATSFLQNGTKTCVYGLTSRPPSGLDVFDASSSDSGFEEITIGSNGTPLSDDQTIPYCPIKGS